MAEWPSPSRALPGSPPANTACLSPVQSPSNFLAGDQQQRNDWMDLGMLGNGSAGTAPKAVPALSLSGGELAAASADMQVDQSALASGAADTAAGAPPQAQAQLLATTASVGEPSAASVAAVPASALAAAPVPPQPLHFVSYRTELYESTHDTEPPVQLRRWMLADSHGRWHLAVDTVETDEATQVHVFSAVEPFSVVRPLRCTRTEDVERYLDQFIPPFARLHPEEEQPPEDAPMQQDQHAQQAFPLVAALAPVLAPILAPEQGAMLQYAASLQPAGVKPKRGRPRIHPPKPPKKPRQPKAQPGAFESPAVPPVPSLAELARLPASAAGAWPLAALPLQPLPAPDSAELPSSGRARRATLAEATFIQSEERRQQVYDLRLEAILAELALLKAQCGAEYSLTLVPQGKGVEVMTSGTANVQAVKVVRRKRSVEKPDDDVVELAGAGSSAAAAAAAAAAAEGEQKEQAAAAVAAAALAGAAALAQHGLSMDDIDPAAAAAAGLTPEQLQLQQQIFQQHYLAAQAMVQQGNGPSLQLLQEWQLEAAQQQQQQQEGAGKVKKRRGRPPASEKKESPAASPPPKRQKAANGRRSSKLVEIEADIKQIAKELKNSNAEPYMPDPWRRQPFEETELEEIDSFVVAGDCGEAVDAAALPAKLLSSLQPGAEGGTVSSDELLVLAELPQGLASGEVDVRPVWGIDRFTRKNIWEVLSGCNELGAPSTPQLDQQRTRFLDQHLLPALNRRDEDGWDIVPTLSQLANGGCEGDAAMAAAAAALLRAVQGIEAFHKGCLPCAADDREWFRVHPKGEGVVLLRAGGLPAGAFVAEYLGELYSAWRWFERDVRAAAPGPGPSRRRALPVRLGSSDEFFNIVMERPPGDAAGFDAMFVNTASKGNFTSRLCHSCEPNCKSVPMVVAGRITIGIWTTQAVAPGQELTLDWELQTESEREFANAVCLCGSASCRGSYMCCLKTGASDPLYQYLASQHSFLKRCQLLLRAGAQREASEAEEASLARHGFKAWALTDGIPGQGGVPLPGWLRCWAASILDFIDREAKELGVLLREQRVLRRQEAAGQRGSGGEGDAEEGTTDADIDADVKHQRNQRVQALAFALDKAKIILRHQEEEVRCAGPLRLLSDQEAVEYLWMGDASVARRAISSLAAFTERQQANGLTMNRTPRNAAPPAWLEDALEPETLEPSVRRRSVAQRSVGPPSADRDRTAAMLAPLPAGAGLLGAASGVSQAGEEAADQQAGGEGGMAAEKPARGSAQPQASGGDAEAAAAEEEEEDGEEVEEEEGGDGNAGSKAAAGRQRGKKKRQEDGEEEEEEQEFESLAEQLGTMVEETEVATLEEAQAALRRLAAQLRAAGAVHAGLHDVLLMYASVRHWVGHLDYAPFNPQLANGEEGARYRPQQLWAVLSCWWRAGSSADPVTVLTNDRRGCLNLPDTDCCYQPTFATSNYLTNGYREALVNHISESPLSAWPLSAPFSFKNSYKVYGSPQLDAVLDGSDAALQGLLGELKQAF